MSRPQTVVVALCAMLLTVAALPYGHCGQVAESDWQHMQTIQRSLYTERWLEAPDIGPLYAAREQLIALIARYGDEESARIWEPGRDVPSQASAMDLRDVAAATAYNRALVGLSRSELGTRARVVATPLGELLAGTQALIGLRTGDVTALRAAVKWTEDYVAKMMAPQANGHVRVFGIPGYYGPCRAALSRQEAGRDTLEPVALFGGVPVRLAQSDHQLFLPIGGLRIPPSQVRWDAETKTATLDLARRVTLATSREEAVVDGVSVKLSAPPRIEDGRLMISVRDVKPLFGLDYKWDPKLWAVRIFAPET